jgi:hypothetical protein
MNYVLAKELKDAGWHFEYFTHEHQALGIEPIEFPDTGAGHPDYRVAPSLEELIEACGEKFARLRANFVGLKRSIEYI